MGGYLKWLVGSLYMLKKSHIPGTNHSNSQTKDFDVLVSALTFLIASYSRGPSTQEEATHCCRRLHRPQQPPTEL